MTDEEKFDRLAAAIERVADASSTGIRRLTEAQLATQTQMGFLAEEMLRLAQQQAAIQQQQTAILQRQAEQDQRFDVLLGEIRHIVQRLEEGSHNG
ncbi:MAG: hypothetical protein NW237_06795 [Cyanobacteriota bacterium]|nr:hypothetical protein [Cyanobacteriota bacterium]